jgi:uncharacterized protein (DUF58 family)
MNIIWFSVVVGLLVLLQMQFFRWTGLWKVTYRRYFGNHAVYEGEKTSMVEVIENRKPLFVPWIRVESRISPHLRFKAMDNLNIAHDQYHRSLFFLRPYMRITRTHEITCAHRGYYALKLASITAGDLFGMTSPARDYSGDSELYVYPRIPAADEVPLPALKFQGDVTMRRWIMPDPILVNGIREYRPGDPQKDIHWGATARTGKLHVKVHDYTVSPRILVLLNVQITEVLWGNMNLEQQEVIE